MHKKKFLLLLFGTAYLNAFSQTPNPLPDGFPSGTKPAFVRVWGATAPETDPAALIIKGLRDVKQTTEYYDGRGRLIQTVTKQGSLVTGASAVDMITAVTYDNVGRRQYQYLPFVSTATDATKNNGLFKLDPFQQQAAFYNTQLSGQSGETNVGPENLNWAYNQTKFEESPLNRVQEAFAPGSSWVGTAFQVSELNRHSVKTKYFTNTSNDGVRVWNVTEPGSTGSFASYNSSTIYANGLLFKVITTDEVGKQAIEYFDKVGKPVLKKVQVTATADNGMGSGHDGWLCTYYVYDYEGKLRCTIMPRGVELISPDWLLTDATILAEQCFRYEYDERGRLAMKKIPGAGEEYTVYDNRGRVVMTQDANMRQGSPAQWLVMLYDKFDRAIETGLWDESNDLSYHITQAKAATGDYPFSSSTVPGSGYERLTRMGYDRYSTLPPGTGLTSSFDPSYTNNQNFFYTSYNAAPDYVQPFTPSTQIRGLVTWTETKVLNSSPAKYLYAIRLYDIKGRLIQVKSTNITDGTDLITTQYGWDGQVLRVVEKQVNGGSPGQTSLLLTKYTYDDLGRVTLVEKKIANTLVNSNQLPATWTKVAETQYDALGQVKTKKIGRKKNPANGTYTTIPLEILVYDYNIRGWLLGINRAYVATQGQSGTSKFGFELGYDKQSNLTGQNFTNAPQYNGNILGVIWKSDGDDVRRKYDFKYDETSRFLKAEFTQQNPGDGLWNNSKMNYTVQMGDGTTAASAYDANGNIKAMTQFGYKPGSNPQIPIDQLTYNYRYNNTSNQLLNVIDALNEPDTKMGDFRTSLLHTQSKTSETVDYIYDDNGNMVKDYNKDILSYNDDDGISYNFLDLPEVVTVKKDALVNKGTITFIYNASGEKLKKIVHEVSVTVPHNGTNYSSNITTTTIYAGAFSYETKAYSNATLNSALGYTERLRMVKHEEGRIRPRLLNSVLSLHYDYFIKDHLGSVRMVLTEEAETPGEYIATIEDANRNAEVQLFTQIQETESPKPTGFDVDDDNSKVSKLFNVTGTDKRVGPGVVLKVMAGDKFKAHAYGWYLPGGTNNNTLPGAPSIFASILGAFTGGLPVGSKYTGTDLNGVLIVPLMDFLSFQGGQVNSSRPKAFLNWMILDEEQFELVAGNYGAVQIPEITSGMQKQVLQAAGGAEIEVIKNGYLYVYVSNESEGNVYFDDIKVEHTRGSLIEETHYYPMGLPMLAISSEALNSAYLGNLLKFQGQEFENSMGLNMLEFEARMYDIQIGRWHVPDPANQFATPYSAMANNWPTYVDPDGRFVLLPVILGAVIGGFVGGVQADMAGRNVFDGIWKGALVGAIGGTVGQFASGSFLAQVGWGAGEGAITGSISSFLNGQDFMKGALGGATWGAAFGVVTTGIESMQNMKEGYGFGTNDGRIKMMLKNKEYSRVMDFARKRFNMSHPGWSTKIDEKGGLKGTLLQNQHAVTLADKSSEARAGLSIFDLSAFSSASTFKRTIVHEYGHFMGMKKIDGVWDLNIIPSFADYGDGLDGYTMEINMAGKVHIASRALKAREYFPKDLLPYHTFSGQLTYFYPANPVWYSNIVKHKWWKTLPSRYVFIK